MHIFNAHVNGGASMEVFEVECVYCVYNMGILCVCLMSVKYLYASRLTGIEHHVVSEITRTWMYGDT